MKKAMTWSLVCLTIVLAISTLGFYIFRNLPTDPPALQYPHSNIRDASAESLDINSATKEELMKLPGIGETYAQRIIDYRQANGPFTSITDLLKVEGIGTQRLESIMDLIKIGGQHEDTGR